MFHVPLQLKTRKIQIESISNKTIVSEHLTQCIRDIYTHTLTHPMLGNYSDKLFNHCERLFEKPFQIITIFSLKFKSEDCVLLLLGRNKICGKIFESKIASSINRLPNKAKHGEISENTGKYFIVDLEKCRLFLAFTTLNRQS